MPNIEVFDRLIDNIILEKTSHNQGCWITDHTNVFTINTEDRWSCATSACAAGFVWLAEAPPDSVFDSDRESVYSFEDHRKMLDLLRKANTLYDRDDYYNGDAVQDEAKALGVPISTWAGEVLGINHSDAMFLFYNFDGTTETLRRLRHLRNGGHYNDYDNITPLDYCNIDDD